MRGKAAAFAGVLVGLLGAGHARAAEVYVAPGPVVVYSAAPGEKNALTASCETARTAPAPPGTVAYVVIIEDSGALITSGAGCFSAGPRATCTTFAATGYFPGIQAALGDENDSFLVGMFQTGSWIDAGPGDDEGDAQVPQHGGDGNDVLTCTQGVCAGPLFGDDGDDTLSHEGFVHGRRGRDTLVGRISYADRTGPVWISLDGVANDGEAGEGDNVKASRTISGSPASDVIVAGAGNQEITAAAGDDHVEGGDGTDLIWGNAGDDTLLGGSGGDYLTGGDGGDTVTGGPGQDFFNAEAGDDVVRMADGEADRGLCGSGKDRFLVDTIDFFYIPEGATESDCERRLRH